MKLNMIDYFYRLGYKERPLKTFQETEKTMQGILQLYGKICYAAYWQGIDDYDSDYEKLPNMDRFNYIMKKRGYKL